MISIVRISCNFLKLLLNSECVCFAVKEYCFQPEELLGPKTCLFICSYLCHWIREGPLWSGLTATINLLVSPTNDRAFWAIDWTVLLRKAACVSNNTDCCEKSHFRQSNHLAVREQTQKMLKFRTGLYSWPLHYTICIIRHNCKVTTSYVASGPPTGSGNLM